MCVSLVIVCILHLKVFLQQTWITWRRIHRRIIKKKKFNYIKYPHIECIKSLDTSQTKQGRNNVFHKWKQLQVLSLLRRRRALEEEDAHKVRDERLSGGEKIREGGVKKKKQGQQNMQGRRCEGGERRKDRRGSTWRTAGPGSPGSSSGSGRRVNVILSSPACCRCINLNFFSNLTFQKRGLIQLSLLSLLLPYATHHFLPLAALFHLFSFIPSPSSYSCHILPSPHLFPTITLLLSFYYSTPLCIFLPAHPPPSCPLFTLDVVEWRAKSIAPA